MRTLKSTPILLLFILLFSCSTDQDDMSQLELDKAKMIQLVQNSEWEITKLSINDTDYSNEYNGFSFKFNETNDLEAKSSIENFIGTWRIATDSGSDFETFYDVDFNIYFSSESKFWILTNNYDVKLVEDGKMILSAQNYRSGEISELEFVKKN